MQKQCNKLLQSCKKNIHKINVVRRLCDHFIGENHTLKHRVGVGTTIMVIGVTIVKVGAMAPFGFIHVTTDVIGYLIHAIGGTPYIEYLIKTVSSDKAEEVAK